MEIFLNFAWAVLSILLIGGWVWSIRKGHSQFQWTTLIALCLLLVLLFPAISMTDDRVAMNRPIETEHMMRSGEAPLGQVVLPGLFRLFAAIILIVLNMAASCLYRRIRPRVFATTLLTGFICAFGVRPPPSADIFAY